MPGAKGKSGGARTGAGRKPKEQSDELKSLLDVAWPVDDRKKVLKKMHAKALKGDVKATTLLMNYAFGKPIDRKEISGANGAPIRFTLKLDNAGALDADGDS